MSLVYVTGVSGTGKSTVLHELQSRGYEAYGVDEEGLADWTDRKTGVVRQMPHPAPPDFDLHKWYKRHEWVLDPQRVRRLKVESDKSKKAVFLCGAAAAEDKAWESFDIIITLVVSAETIKQRIRDRTNNDFGKAPEELEKILHWHSTYEDSYRQFGAFTVDAEQPVEQVVDAILAKV